MDEIERVLNSSQRELEGALARALQEREDLLIRLGRVEDAIRRARAALGVTDDASPDGPGGVPEQPSAKQHVLHDALAIVLRSHGNQPMLARELADEVNRRRLYRRADGRPLEGGQVHARVHAYGGMFVREDGGIRLRDEELTPHEPALLKRFDAAMEGVYTAAQREVRYSARRFLTMVRDHGGHRAAKHLLAKSGTSEGFERLAAARRWAVTMEYQVLLPEFRSLFTTQEIDVARRRLLDAGCPPDQLPPAS